MKKIIWICSLFLLLCSTYVSASEKYYVSGCENGVLLLRNINVWDRPGGIITGARVIGHLSGGTGGSCQGDTITILERQGYFVKIQTEWGLVGWIPKSLIGGKL